MESEPKKTQQSQNIQREQQELAGNPKPARVRKTGAISVKRYEAVKVRTTKSDTRPERKRLLYTPQERNVTIWIFYNLEDLIKWTETHSIAPFPHALIEVRYYNYVRTGSQRGGSDKKIGSQSNLKNYRFAALSGWIRKISLEQQIVDWDEIRAKYANYEIGKMGRVYLYARD